MDRKKIVDQMLTMKKLIAQLETETEVVSYYAPYRLCSTIKRVSSSLKFCIEQAHNELDNEGSINE